MIMHPLTRGSSVAPNLSPPPRRPPGPGRHRGRHRLRRRRRRPDRHGVRRGRLVVHRRPRQHRRAGRGTDPHRGSQRPRGLAVELRHRAGRHLRPDLRRGRRGLRGPGPLRRRDRRLGLRRDRPRGAGRRRPRPHRHHDLPGRLVGRDPCGHRRLRLNDMAQQQQVAEIAPIVTIAYRGSAADVIERVVDLAWALGVDTEGGEVAAARADFEAASETLTEAAGSGVSVLPVFATEADGWWMAKAADDPQLALYQDLGVTFVDPGGEDYFWNAVGWEEVPDHPSDVLLYSLRFSMTPEEIAGQPTAALLPAVQAGQLHPWKYIGPDYVAQAAYMEELAG